jgi:hypothetical protein
MSKIQVNAVEPQCGTNLTLGASGDSIVVSSCASFKTKEVKDASGNIIISRCGSNITIGSSGATVALAAGATQTGFGSSGAVSWDTTAKTTGFTAVSGTGYFVNTTSGAITVTLPASPSAGDIVAISDYAGTAATNNITIDRNGSNFQGSTVNGLMTTNRDSVTVVYVDGTQGWVPVADSTKTVLTPQYIVATGGTITTCGDYKIHTFTSPGTFTVCSVGNYTGSNSVNYLVVAGGGGGGDASTPTGGGGSGGGGGGGYRELYPVPGGEGLSVSAIFSSITSAGGGYGANNPSGEAGGNGGSGGGGAGLPGNNPSGGTGNTPPVSPPQGQNGGPGGNYNRLGGSGGGALGTGNSGGPGGVGAQTTIGGALKRLSGGGGYGGGGAEGYEGGGAGGAPNTTSPGFNTYGAGRGGGSTSGNGETGTANTGGGGGGWGSNSPSYSGSGKSGGSGIVIIRYKYQ